MNPEPSNSSTVTVARLDSKGKQIGNFEKATLVDEEMRRVQLLPPNSKYASHRLRILQKMQQLLSIQRTMSQDQELELLFAGLQI